MDKLNIKEKMKLNWAAAILLLTTLGAISISIYCFSSGWFIVHQNLFYVPIIIGCMFFGRKGFIFSICLSLTYFCLVLYFPNTTRSLLEAAVRVLVFIITAGIVTFLSTKRKQAERQLQNTYAQLKCVINSSSQVSIVATDISGKIITFNTGAEHLLGYSEEEALGKTPLFYYLESELAERGRELSKELGYPVEGFEILIAYAKKGIGETREWTYVKKDGSHIIVNISVTPVRDESEQTVGFLGVASDITERKKLEEELTEKIHNLEVFHKAAVGRELKMIELKNRITELEAELNQARIGS